MGGRQKWGIVETLGRMVTYGNEENIAAGWKRFGEYSHFLKESKILTCFIVL